MVLIMTVEPGFGGQSFMANMMSKVTLLRTRFPLLGIEVDGGISGKTIDTVAQAGANWIVSGSAIIKSDDPAAVIRTLKTTVKKALRPCADCASPCLQHVPTPTAAELAQLFSAL
jgi:ribulose-phosphate 3-epimerase